MPGGAEIRRVFRGTLGSTELRRVGLAFAAFNGAEWAAWIAMLVYAYEQGGATEAGVVALLQLVPAGLFAPFAAVLADQHRPARVLAAGYAAQAAAFGGTAAALLAGAPSPLVYVLAAAATTTATLTRPTQAALVPTLARSPEELTATNVASGWIESLSILAAPAGAGAALALGSPGDVFVGAGILACVAGLLVRRIRGPAPQTRGTSAPLREVFDGFRLLHRDPAARTLVALLGVQSVLVGALDVLYVVLAIGVLERGASWAGYLNAAFGAGGVLAIVVTVRLVGRRRMTPLLVFGAVVPSAALAALAARPTASAALLLLAAAGTGRGLLDVAGRTLLQRSVRPDLVSRVFGVLEGLNMAGLAAGSLLVPALVAAGGAKAALLGLAVVLPLALVVAGRRLSSLDDAADVPVVEIGLLRSLPIFAPLRAPALEAIARRLAPVTMAPGDTVVREGQPGSRFYVVADGELSVTRDGTPLAVLRRGDGFGEIALLRDVPRTATVQARTTTRLLALERDAFLDCLGSHAASRQEAERLARSRLDASAAPQEKMAP